MKLVKTASGKQTIKLSKKEWQSIGKKAGWMKEAQWGQDIGFGDYADMEDPEWMIDQLQRFIIDEEAFWDNMQFQTGDSFKSAKKRLEFLKTMLRKLKAVSPTNTMFSKPEQKSMAQKIKSLQEEEKIEIQDEQRLQEMEGQYERPHVNENVALEDAPEDAPDEMMAENGRGAGEMEDAPGFMNKREIEDHKNSILDSFLNKEITEEQMKTKLLEFARNQRRLVLAAFKGKLKLSKD